jgi:hypothetical protein
VGPHLLAERPTAYPYRNFLKRSCPELLEEMPLSSEADVVVSAWRNSSALRRCYALIERDITRKVHRWTRGRQICDGLCGHLKEYVYAVPFRAFGDLVVRCKQL